ncbi:D-alanyl-D-alanine carboxypeptidase/D-alanyl-D-alanine endopeptidase [Arthrobacter cupressi]|uniref:D-alanyl-D-alanine carboxypeptidase / D-alanyl-D-alanine-endopeptidase (Penicillin-binding protein 4) n=1 Tax=Arthrobacter cupressi TaxID=1045773 RepID=A0A1G8QMG2_9MICC|nr:D-alanyl-D-alanine carboxypeptidase/D-alanyl-D-alanine-endopeptidase (penicillin-binding protein 4) [Arthrobacter cupressi]SDJ05280.1 D-alanyl-D-alanine carboxypeptidase / D-alanyl-D-alanine-endopeptidase (penicillin-binding protein 4) [Arthrobacter cupressi]
MKAQEQAAAPRKPRRPLRGLRWPGAVQWLALSAAIAALAVPMGLNVAPAFFAPHEAPVAPLPPWQRAPEQLSTSRGVEPLDPSAPIPLPSKVAAQLDAALKPDGAGNFTAVVLDALSGDVVYERDGGRNRVPASNMKLLTAVAALQAAGPETRFATEVLAGPKPSTVVLRGGGDVLLASGPSAPEEVMGRAGLQTLAVDTVEALSEQGVTGPVSVQLDDSLFTGKPLNPAWSMEDVDAGETAPLFPLAMNGGREALGAVGGPRPEDAALDAARTFTTKLKSAGAAAGITVRTAVVRAKAPAGAEVLAAVESATVRQQVDLMLETSDNYLAEVLGRMASYASGGPASNDGATAAVRAQLGQLGIDTASMRLSDVSGLSLENRVSARQFAEVVREITSGPDTRLRAALAGFPVAGLTGTLDDRYADASTASGAGLVRAKTGTLNSVIALSGYVVDADGRLLVFSFIGNGLTPGAAGNKVALDRAASALASCGCS